MNKNNQPPIFIIGGSRTGSELLKGILEKYTELSFVNEMHLLAPAWLRKDFNSVVIERAGGFGDSLSTESILDLAKSGCLTGYYWNEFQGNVDIEEFKKHFDGSLRELKNVLDAAMYEKMISNNKKIKGAKFPVHYSFTDNLLEWYPDALLIHTVRDPRAVYYSQSRKYGDESDGGLLVVKKRVLQFAHIVIQSFKTSLLHLKYRNEGNYFIAPYERLLKEPESFFQSLCAYLGVNFNEAMADPRVYSNSSFQIDRGKKRALDVTSVRKWEKKMPLWERAVVTFFTLPALLIFGYKL